MDLLRTRNFARGRLAHRICHTRTWRRLSGPHTMLSLHIRVKRERGESTSVAPDNRAKVGLVNHLLHFMFNQIDVFQSKAYIATSRVARSSPYPRRPSADAPQFTSGRARGRAVASRLSPSLHGRSSCCDERVASLPPPPGADATATNAASHRLSTSSA